MQNSSYKLNHSDELRKEFIKKCLSRMSRYQLMEVKKTLDELVYKLGFHFYKDSVSIPFGPISISKKFLNDQLAKLSHVNSSIEKFEDYCFSDGEKILSKLIDGVNDEWKILIQMAKKELKESQKRRNKRFDGFFYKGKLKILEINSICPQGIFPFYILEQRRKKIYELLDIVGPKEVDIISNLLNWFLVEYKLRGNAGSPKTVAIVYETKEEPGFQYPVLGELLEKTARINFSLPLKVILAKPAEINLMKSRKEIYIRSNKIDIIWKNAIVSQDYDFSSYGAKNQKGRKKVDDFLTVLSHPNRFTIINSEKSRFFSFKKIFSYITQPSWQYFLKFTADEIEAINNCIPDTFDITNCSVSNLIKMQKNIILKPAFGSYGEGVYFGKNYSSSDWNSIVKKCKIKNDYIVQEYLDYKEISINIIDLTDDGYLVEKDIVADFNPQHINGNFIRSGWSRLRNIDDINDKLKPLNLSTGGGLACVEVL